MQVPPESSLTVPEHGTLLLTWACNSRCTTCKIWEIYRTDRTALHVELTLEDYARLLADPLFRNVTSLGLAGGEPLMRRDLFDLIALVPPSVQLFIATNAIALGRFKQLLPILETRGNAVVQISIDGIGETHDRARGVPGNFERCLQALDWLVERDLPRVISSTLTPQNYRELPALSQLARKYGAGLAFRTANKGDFYDNIEDRLLYQWQPAQIDELRSEIAPIVADQLLRGETTDATGVFWNEIPNWLADTLQLPRCLAGYKTFLIDPVGEVYPCPSWWHSLGSIKSTSFGEVWMSEGAARVRAGVDALKCGGCWNDCTWPQVLSHEPEYVNPRVEAIRRSFASSTPPPAPRPASLLERVIGSPLSELRPGQAADAGRLAYGWHAPQDMPPLARWTCGEAAAFVDIPAQARRVGVRVLALNPDLVQRPVEVCVSLDGAALGSRRIGHRGWQTLWFDLPKRDAGRMSKIALQVERTWVPLKEIGTTDSRELGVAVERIWTR